MPKLVRPDIYIHELPIGTRTIKGAETSISAFVGTAPAAPTLSIFLGLCAAALFCVVGIAGADEGKDESGKGRGEDRYYSERGRKDKRHRNNEGGGSYFHEHGYTHLDIPPGHYPPPGECRIWYPERPAGHQPPPGKCSPVPPGAWVIRHPQDHPGHVHVTVYEPRRPGTILVIGEFEIASGAFVRIVLEP